MRYKIQISMEDCDIPRETACVLIKPVLPLCDVNSQINKDFRKYDIADGKAAEYREDYGWGIRGFVEYLNYLHKDWEIKLDFTPDAEIRLVGH